MLKMRENIEKDLSFCKFQKDKILANHFFKKYEETKEKHI